MQILFAFITAAVIMTGTLSSLENRSASQERDLANWSFFLNRLENNITTSNANEDAPSISKVPLISPAGKSFTMEWNIPQSRLNRASLAVAEISGYELYYTSTSHALNKTITIDNPEQTSYTFTDVENGEYLISVAAIDTNGLKSPASTGVEVIVN